LKQFLSAKDFLLCGHFRTVLKWLFFFQLVITVPIDSLFWGKWLWPEGVVLYYNTILNKSGDWGISPFHWYFTSALPRMLLGSIALIPIGIYFERNRIIQFFLPVLTFVVLYSFLPHKELRFIFYVLPIFNLTSALGLARLYRNYGKSKSYNILLWLGIFTLLASFLISREFLYVSSLNYPGGKALNKLHQITNVSDFNPFVFIDVAAAQTGISLYNEREFPWKYSKAENLTDYSDFTHIITANTTVKGFKVQFIENGFKSITVPLLKHLRNFFKNSYTLEKEKWWPLIIVETSPQIYVLCKQNLKQCS